jgi:hypothetical protein
LQVFGELNGTGGLLALLPVPATRSGAGNPARLSRPFCPFAAAGVSVSGIPRPMVFARVADPIVFDDVTFGSVNRASSRTWCWNPARGGRWPRGREGSPGRPAGAAERV